MNPWTRTAAPARLGARGGGLEKKIVSQNKTKILNVLFSKYLKPIFISKLKCLV